MGTKRNISLSVASALLAAAAAVPAQTKIACIGNSITYGYGLSDTTKRYPSVLRQLLGASLYTVQNDGVNSTTMSKRGNIPYWTNGKLDQVFAFQPDIVTIMLGTNDTKPINWDSLGRGTQFLADYLAMVDTLAAMAPAPRIFVALPVPVFSNPIGASWGIRDSVVQKEIPIIRQVAAARGCTVIDANTPLLGFPQYFSVDGVHPNAAGEDTIAHVFYRAIISATATAAPAGNACVRVPTFSGVRTVAPGGDLSAVFRRLKSGLLYECRVFDARGVMTGKFRVGDSHVPRNEVKRLLSAAAGIRLVEVRGL